MRLNVRLMGLLFGLLVIALIARTVLRFAPRGSRRRQERRRGRDHSCSWRSSSSIIGYVGLFFGRLIQAAVSRHRESFADASAVQFTRDPTRFARCAREDWRPAEARRLQSRSRRSRAHALRAGIKRFFATHPDLGARLKAIDPRFDKREFAGRARAGFDASRTLRKKACRRKPRRQSDSTRSSLCRPQRRVAALVGNPGTVHMQVAQPFASLAGSFAGRGSARDFGARVFLALALEIEPEARERQLRFIAQQLGYGSAAATASVLPGSEPSRPSNGCRVLLQAFPALRQLTREERLQLLSCLNGMLQREGRSSYAATCCASLRKSICETISINGSSWASSPERRAHRTADRLRGAGTARHTMQREPVARTRRAAPRASARTSAIQRRGKLGRFPRSRFEPARPDWPPLEKSCSSRDSPEP